MRKFETGSTICFRWLNNMVMWLRNRPDIWPSSVVTWPFIPLVNFFRIRYILITINSLSIHEITCQYIISFNQLGVNPGILERVPRMCRLYLGSKIYRKFSPPESLRYFIRGYQRTNDSFYCPFEQIGHSKKAATFFHVSRHCCYENCGSASHIKSIQVLSLWSPVMLQVTPNT